MSEKQQVVITGATGMVGGLVLRYALDDERVASVTTVGRRPTAGIAPGLQEVTHEDLSDCAPIAEALAGHDAAIFCLGTYSGSVPTEDFHRITVEYALGFARAYRAANPGGTFCLLSGQGADPTGRSRLAFARFKGEAEVGLLQMGFPRLYSFRPGYIYPVEPRSEPNLSYRMMRWVYPLVRPFYQGLGVDSTDLARVMLHAALSGLPDQVSPFVEHREIRHVARAIPS